MFLYLSPHQIRRYLRNIDQLSNDLRILRTNYNLRCRMYEYGREIVSAIAQALVRILMSDEHEFINVAEKIINLLNESAIKIVGKIEE